MKYLEENFLLYNFLPLLQCFHFASMFYYPLIMQANLKYYNVHHLNLEHLAR